MLEYLPALDVIDAEFRGFEHHTHGVEAKPRDGGGDHYALYCLKE